MAKKTTKLPKIAAVFDYTGVKYQIEFAGKLALEAGPYVVLSRTGKYTYIVGPCSYNQTAYPVRLVVLKVVLLPVVWLVRPYISGRVVLFLFDAPPAGLAKVGIDIQVFSSFGVEFGCEAWFHEKGVLHFVTASAGLHL